VLEAGLAIPGDIALIGVSNLAGLLYWRTLQVLLTTVDQDVPRLAVEVTRQILETQDRLPWYCPKKTFVPIKLIVRKST
jgi:DNA-binding LacI/PurR family transcriptional regulator